MRTIVDIPDSQIEALSRICERDRISRAEAIRRAVESLVKQSPLGAEDAFGIWRARKIDSLRYEEKLRSEWERRRRRR